MSDTANLISQLETDAENGNLAGVEQILKTTTSASFAQAPSQSLDQVLQAIDGNLYGDRSNNPADFKVIGDFLHQTVAKIDGFALVNEIQNFAQNQNLLGVSTILSHTASANYANAQNQQLDQALQTIDSNLYGDRSNNAADFQIIGRFINQTVAHIDGFALANEIQNFAQNQNLIGVEAILGHTNGTNYANAQSQQLDQVIQTIDSNLYGDRSNNPADFKVIGDFLHQTVAHIDGFALANEIQNFAQNQNLLGVETILNYTRAANYANAQNQQVDQVLQTVDSNLYGDRSNNAADFKVIGDFLHQTVAHIDGFALANEIQNFAQNQNLLGVQTILANTTAANYANAQSQQLDQVLQTLDSNLYGDRSNNPADFKVIGDFLHQTVAHIDGFALANEIQNFAQNQNLLGVETILAHTTAATYANVLNQQGDQVLQTLDSNLYSDHNTADLKVLSDFLAQMATHIDIGTLANELQNFAQQGNVAGEQIILAAVPALVPHFQTSNGDGLDLSKILTNTNGVQANIDNFIHAATVKGNTVISVDLNGTGNAADFVTAGTIHGVSDANIAHLVAQHHLIA